MKNKIILQHFFAVVLIGILGLAVYSNSFDASFHFDDYTYIVNKKEIRDLGDIRAIYRALGHPSRFIAFWTFALNYHIHRFDVFGYHLVNWFIHFFNSILVYGLVQLLVLLPKIKEEQRTADVYPLAFFCALMFLVHPAQTEAVTYIVQRFTSLAVLFYLIAIISYLKGRLSQGIKRAVYFGVFGVSAVLGMFTKQICFTIPFMVLFIEWLMISSSLSQMIRKRWKMLIVLTLLGLVIPSFFGFNSSGIIGREFASRSHTPDIINTKTYFLTQSRVIPTYIRLLFVPAGQTLDYDFPVSSRLFDAKVIAGFLFLSALAGIAFGCIRRYKLITFGIGWFFLTISVTSSIIPIPHVIFEHHMYLPSVGFILVFNLLVLALMKTRGRYSALMGLVIFLFSVLTYQRNEVWRTDINLWTDIVKKAPNKVRVWNNLGMAHLENEDYEKSIECFNRALSMNENAARVYNNRGLAYAALKQDKEAFADFNQAISLYRHNRETNPDLGKKVWAEIFNNRGDLYIKHKDFQPALDDFKEGYSIDPQNERILYNLGYVHEFSKQFDQARLFYEQSIAANPEFIKPYVGLGFVHHNQGNNDGALTYYNKALVIDPQNGEAYYFRAIVLYEMGRKKEASSDMRLSVDLGFEAQSEELRDVRRKILNMD
ncbi:MAG: tetratricopeptide repeat protein [Candidatus Omnitrophota bacterium]